MKTGMLVVLSWLLVAAPAVAQDERQSAETVSLESVLDGIARREDLSFAVDARAPVDIVVGQLNPREITYNQLHTVLTNNGLAAVAVEDIVNIVPINLIRQYPLPTLSEPNDSIADDQWVTWVYRTERADPVMFVPIMRPILPQQGHLVAHPDSGTIMIVDRYANILRVVALIREMDENSSAESPE